MSESCILRMLGETRILVILNDRARVFDRKTSKLWHAIVGYYGQCGIRNKLV